MKLYPWPNAGVLALSMLTFLSVGAFAQESELAATDNLELRIGVGRNVPTGKEEYSGYLEPVLRVLFSRSGIDYLLITTPVARSLDEANSGILDGAISATLNLDSRFSDLVTLPESIVPVEFAGLYTRDEIVISSADDFFKYRLAYPTREKPRPSGRGWIALEAKPLSRLARRFS